MEAQFDDDTFYAEIKRQILQLTSEDDDEGLLERKGFNQASVGGDGGSTRIAYNNSKSPLANPFCSWKTTTHRSGSPEWHVNLRKSEKGTGVFIPQVVTGNNYKRPGTMNCRKQIYRPVTNKY